MWLVEFGYTNNTAKTIVGAKFNAGWMDATADYHHILDVWGSDSKVKPGAHKKERWNPPPESSHNQGLASRPETDPLLGWIVLADIPRRQDMLRFVLV